MEGEETQRSKKAVTVILGFVLMATGAGWKIVSAAPSKPTLTPQDYIGIYNLYSIYTRYTDMGYGDDGPNYASMFTPDGSFGTGNRAGREANQTAIHHQQGGRGRDGRPVRPPPA